MPTRTSHRWQSKPGNWDALHADRRYPSDNAWGIPRLRPAPVDPAPVWLAPYRTRIRAERPPHDGAIHFFLQDYRFETVWSRPGKALQALRPYAALLSPDFSLYREWPLTLQLWNVYRNRWCGRFWQEEGFRVIPTVSWGAADTYDFCFLGIPPRGQVAVATVGTRDGDPAAAHLFLAGFREMVRRLEPVRVLCYGPAPAACHELVEILTYPTRWAGIRAARRDGVTATDGCLVTEVTG
jgi:hypothetical protein